MTYALLYGLIIFALVSSLTPGPNNLMLMASGANFGFRRTIPHMLGIAIGFTIMVVLVGVGLAQVFDAYPPARVILMVLSVAYLVWLAWKITQAAAPDAINADARPMTFLQAAMFQWVNPKAWSMALSAVTLYTADRSIPSILIVACIFGLVNLPSIGVWTLIGQQIRRFLTSPARLTAFNWTMAALLVLSLWPVIRPYLS